MKLERRFLKTEIRAVGDGDSQKIVGYAATFNQPSQDLGGFVEIIATGAFDECLRENPDILGLFNHNMDFVLGRTSSGTMQVSVDETGLQYTIDPPDTQLARDLMTSMKRGDIRGSSFGFYDLDPSPDNWVWDPSTGILIRTVRTAAIFDCSVVTDPAYLTSDSSVRSQFAQNDEELKATIAERRQALMQGDHDALADLHWRVRAYELLHASERF